MAEFDQSPPPGGYFRDPGPAGSEEHRQEPVERIADGPEGLRAELAEIKRLSSQNRL